VGVILKRQGGGLDGGSTLNQQSATKEQYLISVKKTAINSDFFWKRMYNTAVLDGIIKSIQPEFPSDCFRCKR
jgi:hypothetical protein